MGFLGITKPFKKEDPSHYEGVLVPLAQAQRHSTVTAEWQRRRSEEAKHEPAPRTPPSYDQAKQLDGPVDEGKKGGSDSEDGVIDTSSGAYDPYTIEGLRAEVNSDAGASSHDTAYDCGFPRL